MVVERHGATDGTGTLVIATRPAVLLTGKYLLRYRWLNFSSDALSSQKKIKNNSGLLTLFVELFVRIRVKVYKPFAISWRKVL